MGVIIVIHFYFLMVPNDPSGQYSENIYLIASLLCIHIYFTVQNKNPFNCHHTVVASMGQRGVTKGGPSSPTIYNVVVEEVLRGWVTFVVDAVFLHWVALVKATEGY